jgi:hypothetical protein
VVQRWVERSLGKRLDRVDWENRPSRPRRTHRTARAIEDHVLKVRRHLREESILGEFGARAIREELERRGVHPCPSVRTIGRILERRGALDGRKRVRRPPPPRGWFLPDVAARRCELDRFDTIEGLAIRGGPHLAVLTAIALHSGLVGTWVHRRLVASTIVEDLLEHWTEHGRPGYALFDNDVRFQGPRQHRDAVGRVIRLCLHLEVVPTFAPPLEHGFQADIESYNSRWQAKVWHRFEHRSLRQLRGRSARYLEAVRRHKAARAEDAPPRRPLLLPVPRLDDPLTGRLVFLRRTDDDGCVHFLGRTFPVDRLWTHRLVRADVDLDASAIRFYALRRREPEDQPLLRETPYALPQRSWEG